MCPFCRRTDANSVSQRPRLAVPYTIAVQIVAQAGPVHFTKSLFSVRPVPSCLKSPHQTEYLIRACVAPHYQYIGIDRHVYCEVLAYVQDKYWRGAVNNETYMLELCGNH